MNTLSLYLSDSATMLRRRLRHMLRYPSMIVLLLGEPIALLLMFVYVFGDTLGAGLGDVSGGRAAYVDYVTDLANKWLTPASNMLRRISMMSAQAPLWWYSGCAVAVGTL